MSTEPLLIKRYAQSRLYNTATTSYVTLDDLDQLVLQGMRIRIQEAEAGRDITRDVLDRLH
ncbi:MAG: polyhydroxyalkanoate synthesis regulator DNA-binding domain-containing protein [Xanthobacteraceae bacterium]